MILTHQEKLDDLIAAVRVIVIRGTSEEWVREYGLSLNDEVSQHFNEGNRSAREIAKSIIEDYNNS